MHLRRIPVILTLSVGLVIGCGPQEVERGEGIPATSSSVSHSASPRPRSTTTVHPLLIAKELSQVLRVLYPTTTTTTPVSTTAVTSAPVPSSRRCDGQVGVLIDRIFGTDAPWAHRIVWRESRCIPTARNGASGSAGLFQLYQHDDLLAAVCPRDDPAVSWQIPDCNVRAAYSLFAGSGTGPWEF